jgi:formyl-CoA transferase
VLGGYIRERTGAILPNVSPSNVFPTSDDQMVLIAANQDTVFSRLADAMERPELAEDDRYATHSARGENQVELDGMIAEWTATLSGADLYDRLLEFGVPTGRIYRAPEMLEDEHFAEREAIVTLPHPTLGDFPMQNVAPTLRDTPGEVRWVGPVLGQHNDEIFGGLLELDDAEIDRLRADGIV